MGCLLSVCMIVKNEETNIRRALESIKEVADEIVIVDTGSTDRTVEIAREYTDKIYFFEWTGSFSEARNESLKYATCDWVMVYDADEEASEEIRKYLRNFLRNLSKEIIAVYIPTISYLDFEGKNKEIASTPRLFRRGKVRYENIVHNQPIFKGKAVKADFPLYHYGYIWTRLRRKEKTTRTLGLIKKQLKKMPDDIYYLIQYFKTLWVAMDEEKTYRYGKKIAELMYKRMKKKGKNYIPTPMENEFFYIWGMHLMNLGYNKMAENWLKIGEKWNLDCDLALIYFYEKMEDWEMMKKVSDIFLAKYKEYEKNMRNITWTLKSLFERQKVILAKIKAKIELGEFEDILELVEEISYDNLNDLESLNQFFQYLRDTVAKNSQDKREIALKLAEKIIMRIRERDIDIEFLGNLKNFNVVYEEIRNLKDKYEGMLYVIKENLEQTENLPALYAMLANEFFYGDLTRSLEVLYELKSLRRESSQREKAIIELLIADVLMKMNRLREAQRRYKRVLDIEKGLSKYVKVTIEDLLTKMEPEKILPAFHDLYDEFFSTNFDYWKLLSEMDKFKLSLLDYFFGEEVPLIKYNFALNLKDENKEKELLKIVQNERINKYLRAVASYDLFNYYKEKDIWEKAKEYLHKAMKLSPKMGDYHSKTYRYVGFYFEKDVAEKEDEIIYVSNLSEKLTTPTIVNPIKVWYESKKKGYYYVSPKPEEGVFEEFDKYLKKIGAYKKLMNPLEIKKLLFKVLSFNPKKVLEINTPNNFLEKHVSNVKWISFVDAKYVEFENLEDERFDMAILCNPEYLIDPELAIRKLLHYSKKLLILFSLNNRKYKEDARSYFYFPVTSLNKFFYHLNLRNITIDFINDDFAAVII